MCVINVPSLQLSPKITWPAVPNSLAGSWLLALWVLEAEERKGWWLQELLCWAAVAFSCEWQYNCQVIPWSVPGHMMDVCPASKPACFLLGLWALPYAWRCSYLIATFWFLSLEWCQLISWCVHDGVINFLIMWLVRFWLSVEEREKERPST